MDLEKAQEAVLVKSEKLDDDTPKVHGYDFNNGIDYEKLMDSYLTTGFQATNLGLAIEVSILFSNLCQFQDNYVYLFLGN